MIVYTIELENEFMTFVGVVGTDKEGLKISHRKALIKEVDINGEDNYLILVEVDNDTNAYDYTEVEDPSTPGIAFSSLDAFRTYVLTNLTN